MLYDDEYLEEYEEDATTWIALSDMMTGLMAIFLALSIAILLIKESKRDAIILTVSESIINKLKQKGIDANIDPKTGRLMVSTDTNFDFNSADLKAQGKSDLDTIIPIYAEAIFTLKPEQIDSIDRILIEGHTDKVGSYVSNMTLSSQRANAILTYIDSMDNFKYKDQLLRKLTAVGRGENDATGADNRENPADRKVVIRFEFKDGTEEQSNSKDATQTIDYIDQMSSQ